MPPPPAGARRRAGLTFSAGFFAAAALFGIWLVSYSDPSRWWTYSFQLPLQQARLRRAGWYGWPHPLWPNFLALLTGGNCCYFLFSCSRQDLLAVNLHHIPLAARLLVLVVFYLSLGRLLGRFHRRDSLEHRSLLATVLVLSAYLGQAFYIHHTLDHAVNGLPFLGLFFGCGLGLCPRPARPPWVRGGALTLIALVGAAVFASGVEVSYRRLAHDTVRAATSFHSLSPPPLRPLQWGEPTVVAGELVTAAEIEQLYERLARHQGNFFIYPELQILYGLTGRPAPQPLSWFQYGVTYPGPADLEAQLTLDQEIVHALRRFQVDLIVLTGSSSPDQVESWQLFPSLRAYVQREFHPTGRIGPFFFWSAWGPEG